MVIPWPGVIIRHVVAPQAVLNEPDNLRCRHRGGMHWRPCLRGAPAVGHLRPQGTLPRPTSTSLTTPRSSASSSASSSLPLLAICGSGITSHQSPTSMCRCVSLSITIPTSPTLCLSNHVDTSIITPTGPAPHQDHLCGSLWRLCRLLLLHHKADVLPRGLSILLCGPALSPSCPQIERAIYIARNTPVKSYEQLYNGLLLQGGSVADK